MSVWTNSLRKKRKIIINRLTVLWLVSRFCCSEGGRMWRRWPGGPPRAGAWVLVRAVIRRGQRLVRAIAIRLDCWRSHACGRRFIVSCRSSNSSSKLVVNRAVTCSQAAKYRHFRSYGEILPWHRKSTFIIISISLHKSANPWFYWVFRTFGSSSNFHKSL